AARRRTRENSRRSAATAPNRCAREYSPTATPRALSTTTARQIEHSPASATNGRSRKSTTRRVAAHSKHDEKPRRPLANVRRRAVHSGAFAINGLVPTLPPSLLGRWSRDGDAVSRRV